MTCPDCGAAILPGRWVTVRVLDAQGRAAGWRGAWAPDVVSWCAGGHGPFQVPSRPNFVDLGAR